MINQNDFTENNPGKNILIADDDIAVRIYLSANLLKSNYKVLVAADGVQALDIFKDNILAMILLDLSLPHPDGFEICRIIRQRSAVPIIILSEINGEDEKVKCLEMGADDYVVKPFSIRELMSRIRAISRRIKLSTPVKSAFQCGDLEIDFENRSVYVNNREIELTATEFSILYYLALNEGKPVSSNYLLQNIWQPELDSNSRRLWVNMSRLRSKIRGSSSSESYIQSRFGQGYILRKGSFSFQ